MPDAQVAISPGSGVNVDVSQLTRGDGTVVERQRMVVGSDNLAIPSGIARVSGNELASADVDVRVLLGILIREVRMLRRDFVGWANTGDSNESENPFNLDEPFA